LLGKRPENRVREPKTGVSKGDKQERFKRNCRREENASEKRKGTRTSLRRTVGLESATFALPRVEQLKMYLIGDNLSGEKRKMHQ